jgi:hypothetical protein
MLNVILAALVDQKLVVKSHSHFDDVTPCVRSLDVKRSPLGSYEVRAIGPDGQSVYFADAPYRYAQIRLFRDRANGPLFVSLDFTNAWATDATGPSFGIACERRHLFYYLPEYHQPGINSPQTFRPGTP